MSHWSISTDDENYGASLIALFKEEKHGYKADFGSGKHSGKSDDQTDRLAFLQAVKDVVDGKVKEEDLLRVYTEEGRLIKYLYELRVPGFRAFFHIDFKTGNGKVVLLLPDPVDRAQIEAIIRRWRTLE
jgi:hypothetical protein